jgi:hypothetical protein
MLQSFIVYGLLGLTFCLLGIVAAKRKRLDLKREVLTPFWTWEVLFALIIVALISGIRWNVGTDYLGYLRFYQDLFRGWELEREGLEIGFVYFSKFFANLKMHFVIYFSLCALFQFLLVFYAFKNERQLYPYLGIIVIFGGQYLMWLNGMRQALAACIFVFSIKFILKRELIKYLAIIIFAVLFHQSAIILIIFYFIPVHNYFRNEYISISLIFVSIIVGQNPNWLLANENLSKIIGFVGYDNYAVNLLSIIVDRSKEMAVGPRRIIMIIQSIFVVLGFYKLYRRTYSKEILIYFNMALIGVLHFNLFANAGSLFLRPTYYFSIFMPIVVSYLLYDISRSFSRYRVTSFSVLFLASISNLIFAIISDSSNIDSDYTNFKFFWNYV